MRFEFRPGRTLRNLLLAAAIAAENPLVLGLPEPASSLPPLVLGTGEQRLLSVPGLRRYSVGSDLVRAVPVPAAAGESTSPDTILLKGVREGLTDLWVWKTDGAIEHRPVRIEKWRPSGKPDLWRSLGALAEVEVVPLPPGVLLRGEIRSIREAGVIAHLLETHPGQVRNHALPTLELLESSFRRLNDWLRSTRFGRSVRAEIRASSLWLTGSWPDSAQAESLKEQARVFFPLIRSELSSAPTVYFRVFLLEAREDETRSLGLDWPQRTEGILHVTPWAIRKSLDIPLALETLSREGRLRILSKPSLALRVPGEASLFSGGELPIRNTSRNTSNVTWRRHGLSLNLRAEALAGEVIRLEILTGVSQLDVPSGVDDIPGIRSNQLRTQVEAKLGVPLLLSGLTQERDSESGAGLPFLSRIPVFGSLFGTQAHARERAELLAVLLPLSSPPEPPMEELGEEFPRGKVPAPRNWIPLARIESLKTSGDYPWNVFAQ